MLSQEQIDLLQKNANYVFKDINNLQIEIISFNQCFFPTQHSSTHPIMEMNHRKKLFIINLFKALEALTTDADEKDLFYLKMEKNDALLKKIYARFKIEDLLNIPQDDPLYGYIIANAALFVLSGIMRDTQEYESWFRELITTFILELRKSTSSSSYGDIKKYGLRSYKARMNPLANEREYNNTGIYEKEVLNLFKDIKQPLSLQPLIDTFEDNNDDKNNKRYHDQFLPYILEETRASIVQNHDVLLKGLQSPDKNFTDTDSYTFNLEIIDSKGRYNDEMELQVYQATTKKLPILDHGFSLEVILLSFNGAPVRNIERNIVIAQQYSSKIVNGPNGNKDKEITLKLLALPDSINLGSSKGIISCTGYWLSGLTSYSRMYEACLYPRKTKFTPDIITGNLQPWPARDQLARLTAMSVSQHLNYSQFDAVSRFSRAKEGIYFLQGPPGTGKTSTIINLLSVLSQDKKKRIMVCAPSNKAVRLLVERTHSAMPSVQIALTGIAKDLPESLRDVYIQEYAERMRFMLENNFDFESMQTYLNQSIEKDYSVQDLRKFQEKNKKFFQKLRLELEKHKLLYKRLLNPTNYPIDNTAEEKVNKLKNIVQEGYLLPILDELTDKISNFIDYLIENPINHWPDLSNSKKQKNKTADPSIHKNMLEELKVLFERNYKNLFYYIDQLKASDESIEILLLQQAQIVFSTLVSSGRKWLSKYLYKVDILIIDEAGQALEPEALIPHKFEPEKCLHVGDTKQLPATIISSQAQKNGFDRSMMLRLTGNNLSHGQMLEVQYRMHPAICKWPASEYYGNRLESDNSLYTRISPLTNIGDSRLAAPCVFIDVEGEEDKQVVNRYGIKNTKEANVIIRFLAYLLKYLSPSQIGIISFYAAQVAYLKENINNLPTKGAKDVMISTVDGFQGEEKDVIIISAVRTTESVGFLRDDRRLNVAVTRARHHLYIFGKKSTLRDSNSSFNSLLPHYEFHSEECQIISHTEIVPAPVAPSAILKRL